MQERALILWAKNSARQAVVMVAAILMMLAAVIAAPAQAFKTLLNFKGSDGANPQFNSLVQGKDGDLYGTACAGGGNGYGTVFRLADGKLTTLYSFQYFEGDAPCGGLLLASDGSFYGTTELGGISGQGTIFKISPSGGFVSLVSFAGFPTNGGTPTGELVQGTDANFYGTTISGGIYEGCANGCGCGTVFKMTPEGALTTLHDFDSTDGACPYGGLVQGVDGNFYGTTNWGGTGNSCGSGGCGTVFSITPGGVLRTLHSFDSTDGAFPWGVLAQGSDGNFYGTTQSGGAGGWGTVFQITPAGALTTLHGFVGTDGGEPFAPLVQATDGSFYGTTVGGGINNHCPIWPGCGTVFKITSAGAFTTLHEFVLTDGSYPYPGLVQDTNGTLYGGTFEGGDYNHGTLFGLSVGLGEFVKMVPVFGNVGAAVTILGTKLTGATGVTFNGTPASFTLQSKTAIKATVPTGATTGPVQVVTPSGTLTSNVNFRVIP